MTALVEKGRCHWVSNEGMNVLPQVTATGPPVRDDLAAFVLGVDGHAVAWTHGHGQSMTWLADQSPRRAGPHSDALGTNRASRLRSLPPSP